MRHEIQTLSAQEIQRKLDQFELDLGLSYLDDQPLAACSVRTVFRERYVLVAAEEASFDSNHH